MRRAHRRFTTGEQSNRGRESMKDANAAITRFRENFFQWSVVAGDATYENSSKPSI